MRHEALFSTAAQVTPVLLLFLAIEGRQPMRQKMKSRSKIDRYGLPVVAGACALAFLLSMSALSSDKNSVVNDVFAFLVTGFTCAAFGSMCALLVYYYKFGKPGEGSTPPSAGGSDDPQDV